MVPLFCATGVTKLDRVVVLVFPDAAKATVSFGVTA